MVVSLERSILNRYENLKKYTTDEIKTIIKNNYDEFCKVDKSLKDIDILNFTLSNISDSLLNYLDVNLISGNVVDLRELVGRGYDVVLLSKNKFVCIKGSRGSKKSTTVALKIIWLMLKYPKSNAVVFRFNQASNSESTYLAILKALDMFGLEEDKFFKVNKTTKEIEFIETQQTIRFKGIQNAGVKNTSMEVKQKGGYWNIAWLEEAYEVSNKYESDFDKILDSFARAKMEDGYFPQFFITFNPYSDKIWLKNRFFNDDKDKRQPDTLAVTTTWRCNDFLDDSFIEMRLHEEKYNPRKAAVNSLGQWGMTDGLIFENIKIESFDPMQLPIFRGLDYGKISDPTAYVSSYLDIENRKIYVFNEFYKTDLDTDELKIELIDKYNLKGKTVFSEVEHLINKSLAKQGVNIIQVHKKRNNLLYELDTLANFEIIIHPRCENFISEIQTYALDEKGYPIDKDNHLMDAFRYSYNAVLYPDDKRYKYNRNGERTKANVNSVYRNLSKLL